MSTAYWNEALARTTRGAIFAITAGGERNDSFAANGRVMNGQPPPPADGHADRGLRPRTPAANPVQLDDPLLNTLAAAMPVKNARWAQHKALGQASDLYRMMSVVRDTMAGKPVSGPDTALVAQYRTLIGADAFDKLIARGPEHIASAREYAKLHESDHMLEEGSTRTGNENAFEYQPDTAASLASEDTSDASELGDNAAAAKYDEMSRLEGKMPPDSRRARGYRTRDAEAVATPRHDAWHRGAFGSLVRHIVDIEPFKREPGHIYVSGMLDADGAQRSATLSLQSLIEERVRSDHMLTPDDALLDTISGLYAMGAHVDPDSVRAGVFYTDHAGNKYKLSPRQAAELRDGLSTYGSLAARLHDRDFQEAHAGEPGIVKRGTDELMPTPGDNDSDELMPTVRDIRNYRWRRRGVITHADGTVEHASVRAADAAAEIAENAYYNTNQALVYNDVELHGRAADHRKAIELSDVNIAIIHGHIKAGTRDAAERRALGRRWVEYKTRNEKMLAETEAELKHRQNGGSARPLEPDARAHHAAMKRAGDEAYDKAYTAEVKKAKGANAKRAYDAHVKKALEAWTDKGAEPPREGSMAMRQIREDAEQAAEAARRLPALPGKLTIRDTSNRFVPEGELAEERPDVISDAPLAGTELTPPPGSPQPHDITSAGDVVRHDTHGKPSRIESHVSRGIDSAREAMKAIDENGGHNNDYVNAALREWATAARQFPRKGYDRMTDAQIIRIEYLRDHLIRALEAKHDNAIAHGVMSCGQAYKAIRRVNHMTPEQIEDAVAEHLRRTRIEPAVQKVYDAQAKALQKTLDLRTSEDDKPPTARAKKASALSMEQLLTEAKKHDVGLAGIRARINPDGTKSYYLEITPRAIQSAAVTHSLGVRIGRQDIEDSGHARLTPHDRYAVESAQPGRGHLEIAKHVRGYSPYLVRPWSDPGARRRMSDTEALVDARKRGLDLPRNSADSILDRLHDYSSGMSSKIATDALLWRGNHERMASPWVETAQDEALPVPRNAHRYLNDELSSAIEKTAHGRSHGDTLEDIVSKYERRAPQLDQEKSDAEFAARDARYREGQLQAPKTREEGVKEHLSPDESDVITRLLRVAPTLHEAHWWNQYVDRIANAGVRGGGMPEAKARVRRSYTEARGPWKHAGAVDDLRDALFRVAPETAGKPLNEALDTFARKYEKAVGRAEGSGSSRDAAQEMHVVAAAIQKLAGQVRASGSESAHEDAGHVMGAAARSKDTYDKAVAENARIAQLKNETGAQRAKVIPGAPNQPSNTPTDGNHPSDHSGLVKDSPETLALYERAVASAITRDAERAAKGKEPVHVHEAFLAHGEAIVRALNEPVKGAPSTLDRMKREQTAGAAEARLYELQHEMSRPGANRKAVNAAYHNLLRDTERRVSLLPESVRPAGFDEPTSMDLPSRLKPKEQMRAERRSDMVDTYKSHMGTALDVLRKYTDSASSQEQAFIRGSMNRVEVAARKLRKALAGGSADAKSFVNATEKYRLFLDAIDDAAGKAPARVATAAGADPAYMQKVKGFRVEAFKNLRAQLAALRKALPENGSVATGVQGVQSDVAVGARERPFNKPAGVATMPYEDADPKVRSATARYTSPFDAPSTGDKVTRIDMPRPERPAAAPKPPEAPVRRPDPTAPPSAMDPVEPRTKADRAEPPAPPAPPKPPEAPVSLPDPTAPRSSWSPVEPRTKSDRAEPPAPPAPPEPPVPPATTAPAAPVLSPKAAAARDEALLSEYHAYVDRLTESIRLMRNKARAVADSASGIGDKARADATAEMHERIRAAENKIRGLQTDIRAAYKRMDERTGRTKYDRSIGADAKRIAETKEGAESGPPE